RTRYAMLETLRQFAREKALDAGETEWLSTRQLAWYAHVCKLAGPALQGRDRHEWLNRLDADLGNLQVALDRAQHNERDAETGLVMMTRTLAYGKRGGTSSKDCTGCAACWCRRPRRRPSASEVSPGLRGWPYHSVRPMRPEALSPRDCHLASDSKMPMD